MWPWPLTGSLLPASGRPADERRPLSSFAVVPQTHVLQHPLAEPTGEGLERPHQRVKRSADQWHGFVDTTKFKA
jgi:hypothetical protein